MSVTNKWLSKDGKYYDTAVEQMAADSAWRKQREEQETQNKLLEEQNRLLQQQAQREADKLKHEKEMALIERETQIELQEKQMEHEEKMRLLKLFDNVGLNKSYYDNFQEYLFGSELEDRIEFIANADTTIETSEKQIDLIKSCKENPDIKTLNTIMPELNLGNIIEAKEIFEKYLKEPNNNISKELENYFVKKQDTEYINIMKKHKSKCIIKGTVLLILEWLPFMLGLASTDIFEEPIASILTIVGFIGWGVCLGVGIYYFIQCGNIKKCIKPLVEKELEKINGICKDPINTLELENHILECEKTLKEMVVSLKDLLKDAKKSLKDITPRWNDFVKFRQNHYNSKIENLLLETGLQNKILSIGLEYPKINVNNKKGDGTIEDYIAYFDSFNN